MTLVKLGKKGQVSLPQSTSSSSADGAVVLRPAAVYPIEIYSDERLREFEETNRLSSDQAARVEKVLKRRKR